MARRLRLISVLLVLALAGTGFFAMRGCDGGTTDTFTCELGGKWFTLETAISESTQQKGLMHREEIVEDGGMIFIFDNDQERSFWMAYCVTDMDIMYVDRTGRIISAYTMKARPARGPQESVQEYEARIRQDRYPSNGKCRYVIEVQAGMIRKLGLKKGDLLDLDLKRLERLADAR